MMSKLCSVSEYLYCPTSIQILTVCLDVSFLATQYGFVGRWLNPGRETIGALDLGGASTQITFETSEKVENEENVLQLQLYGQIYKLYTQSFLCYGQDQFLRKLLAHLIMVLSTKE